MKEIIAKFSVFNSQEFIFLGMCFILFLDIIYFLWHFFSTRFFIKRSSKASAVVLIAKVVGEENEQYQELTLVFKDDSGIEFAPVIDNKFKFREKGERVEIFYSKKDPSNIRINDWRSLHMKSFVSFAAMLVTLGIGYYLFGKKLF